MPLVTLICVQNLTQMFPISISIIKYKTKYYVHTIGHLLFLSKNNHFLIPVLCYCISQNLLVRIECG